MNYITIYRDNDEVYFQKQAAAAEFLGIRNCSKESLEARCRKLGYEIEFDEPSYEPDPEDVCWEKLATWNERFSGDDY